MRSPPMNVCYDVSAEAYDGHHKQEAAALPIKSRRNTNSANFSTRGKL
jgi:hypothetical protein